MKKLWILVFVPLLAISACKKDDEPDNLLNYDGPNFTGPILAAGDYEAAARFTPAQTGRFEGRRLEEVTWFMGVRPASCKVHIYGPGSANSPGALLYSAEIQVDNIQVPAWNTHRLSPTLPIDGEDLWISIAFTHTQEQQSIGCDAGPNRPNGDWLFDSNDGQWETFLQRTTTENINWNIRGVVGD